MDLIIGAGVTGLSYANFTKNDYIVLEKDVEIGGYCKTIKKDGFVWDYSGHFFHFNDKDIKNYIFNRMEKQKIYSVNKNTQIYYKGSYIDFPFQKNIHQLEYNEFIDCLYDLFHRSSSDHNSFKQMLLSKFGDSICEKFLFPYNEKLYACDLDSLDKDAMGRFFPYAKVEDIISNFKQQDTSSYNSKFTYPEGGAIEYVKALMKDLDAEKVFTNESAQSIDLGKKMVITSKGREILYDNLVTTMPFNLLLQLVGLDEKLDVYTSNQVLVFNLGFDQAPTTKNHWIYIPSKEYIFYRVGIYSNILESKRMSLYVEIGRPSDEKIGCVKDILIEVLRDLKKIGVISGQKLVSHNFLTMNPAYVHINKESNYDMKHKMDILKENNIFSIGRYGAWRYCSIEDNIIEARELAKNLAFS